MEVGPRSIDRAWGNRDQLGKREIDQNEILASVKSN
jgi:hypothetical protein